MTNQYLTDAAKKYIDLADKYGAHNYHPLNVVITKGSGEWVCHLSTFNL